jgi:thymidylate kinase
VTRDVTPPGRFITFEGGEAAGKSTQIVRLAARLRAAGHTVLEVREPGATPLGEKVRHLLKHDPASLGMSPEAELLLMNASRADSFTRGEGAKWSDNFGSVAGSLARGLTLRAAGV